jgi:mannose-6-phosphate isomerase-like protein (cupin superfamily)
MEPFEIDLAAAARDNEWFRSVLYTGEHAQVVAMTLNPHEAIGEEVHDVDQLFVVVDSHGDAVLNGVTRPLEPGELLYVPAGTRHDVRNRGVVPMKLLTLYAPPQHAPGTIHRTRAEALVAEELEHVTT